MNQNVSLELKSVSPSVAQALYSEITGKSEKLIKIYNKSYVVQRIDIENLLKKLGQLSSSYDLQGINATITCRFSNGEVEKHSRLDRFSASDISSGRVTESIEVDFTFLIKHAQFDKYQNYKLELMIQGGDISDADHDLVPFRIISAPMVSRIEYVDYAVARTL